MRRKSSSFVYLAIFLAAVFAAAGYLMSARPGKAPRAVKKPETVSVAPGALTSEAEAPSRQAKPEPSAKVAIIIDDMGSDMRALDLVLGLGYPVSVAVLPRLGHSAETARLAREAGRDVLLHLPMQPKGGGIKGLGPGALMEGMDGEAIRKTVSEDLETVPGAVGVNNHMGSSLTEDMAAMRPLMEALRSRGLAFVDSRTSAGSVACRAARDNGVRAGTRKVFLDNTDDPEEIRKQFDRMVKLAVRDGEVIAIGHPRPDTLEVLKDGLPGLKEKGVLVVRVTELTR